MRFHIGGPPAIAGFQPAESGWTALREPRPALLNVVAIPFCLLAVVVLSVAWGREPTFTIAVARSDFGRFAALAGLLAVVLLGIPLLIVVHELIHALGYPRFGFSDSTIIGVWPSRFLFYAAYLEGMGRNRWLLVYLLPFLALSVVPVVVCRAVGIYSGWLHAISLMNGLFSGGDLFCVLLIWCQVPSTATIQNHGWATWWKTEVNQE